MSLKKFPIFTLLNVIDILLACTAFTFAYLRWKGFLKDCPSSSILIDAVYGTCGFMFAIGLIGILATITRSKISIYFYKFLLFLAFVVAGAFITLTLCMKSGVANFILQFGWGQTPDSDICVFQQQFGCAGWSSTCMPGIQIDGCPTCTFPQANVTTHTTAAPFPTCKTMFQDFFDDQFKWILIGAGGFIAWVIILNIAAYCAGQQFSLLSIDDDEEYLLARAERRREVERLLDEDEARRDRAPLLNSDQSMRNVTPKRVKR
eukprot:GILI01026589.1.p1 GENE.GILI01026589.1~~GILI01026589.1.p1  ORF type:complete len:262 (-),score=16.87 GILI01026589.1:34-819(-)